MMFDIAAAIDQGKREYQEDALAYGLHEDLSPGFVVLADGMGGHAAGSMASGLVVTAVHNALAERLSEGLPDDELIAELLRLITLEANATITHYVSEHADAAGMGTTLVVPVLNANHLHWASVGDSPLYLFRDGVLLRLNEDHSLAPTLDALAAAGLMDREFALAHPDRSCLTSALVGAEIPHIDCGAPPILLEPGDIVIASSDGLLFLSHERIEDTLAQHASRDSETITDALMQEIRDLDHPAQDNVSIVVIKVAGRAG